ncbi:MAG: ECF-type sigma factor, partial [Planctomycetota bacterium]
ASAQKRGGGWRQLTLSGLADTGVDQEFDVLALEEALTELERLDERQCRIIECRYLGGLTIEETARVIGVSPRTVELDAKMARHWLNARLGAGP